MSLRFVGQFENPSQKRVCAGNSAARVSTCFTQGLTGVHAHPHRTRDTVLSLLKYHTKQTGKCHVLEHDLDFYIFLPSVLKTIAAIAAKPRI